MEELRKTDCTHCGCVELHLMEVEMDLRTEWLCEMCTHEHEHGRLFT